MNTNKKILSIIIGFIALIFGFGFVFVNYQESGVDLQKIQEESKESSSTEIETSSTSPEIVTVAKQNIDTESKKVFETAWSLFQKYLSFNKDSDLKGVKSTVYKVSQVCNTETPSEECKNRMNSAYSYGSVLKKQDFKNVWFDEKQIIISTDFWIEESTDMGQYGRFRSIIFFVKKDGEWKMLSFSPFKGAIVALNSGTKTQVEEMAINQSKDEDKDGLPDYEEFCPTDKTDSSCIKTDSSKRDSNGDGFWDGVEILMNKSF